MKKSKNIYHPLKWDVHKIYFGLSENYCAFGDKMEI